MPSPRRLKQSEPARAPALKQRAARSAEPAPAHAGPRPVVLADLHAATPGQVLRLQRQVGNRALNRALAPRPAQSQLSAKPASEPLPTPEALVEQLAQPLQRQAARPVGLAGGEAGGAVEAQLAARRGAGAPLPTATRAAMEGGIGADFSSVRIHTGPESQVLNRQLGAQAFTYGADIYMGAGKYAPGTSAGRRLLAHELTHVVQQGGALPAPAAGQTAQRSGAELPGQETAAPGAAPTAIQRDLMTTKELMEAIGGERADNEVTGTAGFADMLGGMATFQGLLREAEGLKSYNNKEKFWTAASALFRRAATCVLQIRANLNLVKEANAVPGIQAALPVLDTLRRQLEDEAMIQIIDLALEAEKKFSLVQTDELKHAKRVGEYHTDRGGRLKVLREKLGGGAINSVSLLQDMQTGTEFVFKADKTEGMVALDEVGAQIAEGARGFADRAVASYRLDQLLGFDVIPETHYASKGGYFGHIMKMATGASPQAEVRVSPEQAVRTNDPNYQALPKKVHDKEVNIDNYYTSLLDTMPLGEGQKDVIVDTRRVIGTKVLRAHGERFVIQHAYRNFDYSQPEIQEGLTSLQLIDLIAGQVDRHPGNYFIGVDPATRQVRVTAIDNDASFGVEHTDLRKTIKAGHLPGLPQVVSKAQWNRIKQITDDQIRGALHGTIRPDEIESTVARFGQLKKHLQRLATRNQLVDRFDRSTFVRMVEADARTAEGQRPPTSSYLGRDVNVLRERAEQSRGNLVLDARVDERTEGVPTANPLAANRYRPLPQSPRQWQRGRLAYEPK